MSLYWVSSTWRFFSFIILIKYHSSRDPRPIRCSKTYLRKFNGIVIIILWKRNSLITFLLSYCWQRCRWSIKCRSAEDALSFWTGWWARMKLLVWSCNLPEDVIVRFLTSQLIQLNSRIKVFMHNFFYFILTCTIYTFEKYTLICSQRGRGKGPQIQLVLSRIMTGNLFETGIDADRNILRD